MKELVTDDDIVELKMVHSQLGNIPADYYTHEASVERQKALKLIGSAISLEAQ